MACCYTKCMDTTNALAIFIAKVMKINATTAGMGGAAAGIIGASSSGEPTVRQAKQVALDFATAFRNDADSETTQNLARELEGLLSTLQIVAVLTTQQYQELADELHNLLTGGSHEDSRVPAQ